jgi:16S rRNA (guanine966-N2)-methyltransferase
MLKVIAGSLKGRTIPYVKAGTYRPSTNKLREALFSIVSSGDFAEENILDENTNFLDLFSGTGAVAFEAISRGVSHATFIDIAKEHISLAEETAKNFGVKDKCSFVRCNALNLPEAKKRHHLVFIDPPYKEVKKSFISKILQEIEHKNWLASRALVVIEMHKTSDIEELLDSDIAPKFEVAKTKLYGNSKLYIMRFLEQ